MVCTSRNNLHSPSQPQQTKTFCKTDQNKLNPTQVGLHMRKKKNKPMLQGMLKEHFQIPCLFDPTEPVPTLL